MLKKNFEEVEAKIQAACDRVGRKREEVTLIAVSKTKPVELIQEAYDLGARIFGENKVQEIVDKYDELPDDIAWHMIGHLHRNKVKYIVDKVALIHSVDSLRLAEAIEKEASKKETVVDILIEVNVAKEDTKFGVMPEDAAGLILQISKMPHIRVRGLMTIAPFVDNPEDNRGYFRRLRNLAVDIGENKSDNVTMSVLSMGMTNDYEIAIEEGATMVRGGTGLFGARSYR